MLTLPTAPRLHLRSFVWGSMFLFLGMSALVLWVVTASHLEAQKILTAPACEHFFEDMPLSGFASPADVFTETRVPLVTVSCLDTFAYVSAGSDVLPRYVYHVGYEWSDGAWREIRFDGDTNATGWISGVATARLARDPATLQKQNYVVAYICTFDDGRWKCGCTDRTCAESKWHLQRFSKIPAFNPVEFDEEAVIPFEVVVPDIAVFYPSQYVGARGSNISLTGYGFAPAGNSVVFVGQDGIERAVHNVLSPSTRFLSLRVPDDMPYGAYSVYVRHAGGRSFNSALFVVQRPGTRTAITSVEPKEVRAGSSVALHGTFAREGNMVYVGTDILTNVPSPDGKTISIEVAPFKNMKDVGWGDEKRVPIRFPVHIMVANEYGYTHTPVHVVVIF